MPVQKKVGQMSDRHKLQYLHNKKRHKVQHQLRGAPKNRLPFLCPMSRWKHGTFPAKSSGKNYQLLFKINQTILSNQRTKENQKTFSHSLLCRTASASKTPLLLHGKLSLVISRKRTAMSRHS
jgi:hypothetical protein